MKFPKILALVLIAALPLIAGAKAPKVTRMELVLPTTASVSRMFGSLDYGLRIQMSSDVSDNNLVDYSELTQKELKNLPKFQYSPDINQALEQYVDSYARGLGFKVGASYDTDYILKINVQELRLRIKAYNLKQEIFSSSAAAVITWELLDADRNPVISRTTSTGRAASKKQTTLYAPFAEAYVDAFNKIDWEAIAQQLKKGRTAKDEANKQVDGSGNTALESTVIRWFIGSRPQGADVSWRVVSSTPDVKNTNSNYVGSTPYESTESFDIKGLTYNNSGNVQIEVTCERPGYLPQKKRFNLRQVIDQKEISAQFNLVKEATDTDEE